MNAHISEAAPANLSRPRAWLSPNWPIVAILVAYLVLGVAYSVVNPLHEATDELRHYRFIQHLIQLDRLPVQGELACSTQGHHPPLYYATAALIIGGIDTGRDVCYEPPGNPFWAYRYWEVGSDNKNQYLHGADEAFPWGGEALAAHLARFVNLLFGAATVWLTWLTARAIWPERRALAAGSAAFVAFNPMFLYLAGAINNDVIAAMAGAAVVYACVKLLLDERGLTWRWGVALGLLFGLALMSKFNLAAIIVVIEAAVTWVAWRKGQWRQWLVVNALIVGLSLLVAGWWFVRNQFLYGEPTGFERLTELWGVRDPRDSFGLALRELPYVWTSLWGRFGYGQIPLPTSIYLGLGALALVAVAGYGVALIRRRPVELRAAAAPLALLALTVLVFFGVIFNYLLVSPAGPMGRFFFPALSSLAILMFYGLSLWLPGAGRDTASPTERPLAPERALAWVTAVSMATLSVLALAFYLAPAYAQPPGFDAGEALPNPVNIQFDAFVALRGYDVDAGPVEPGQPITLRLYYEVTAQPPGDYLMFVHAVDRDTGALVAQRDTHPGLGNFPSSGWQPGDRFVETLRLYVPETAYAPSVADLSTGFYAAGPDSYRLGITDAATGAGLGDSYPLGEIAFVPRTAAPDLTLPNPSTHVFEDRLMLVGYDYDSRTPAAGGALGLTLYWQALQAGLADYEVQVRLLAEDGSVLASYETRPGGGGQPTTRWIPGETVADGHTIPLPPELTGQTVTVQIAVRDAAGRQRLNLVGADGRWLDDKLRLSPLVVR
jgi:hypothetical protein